MTLSQQRQLFSLLLAKLIVWVHENLPEHSIAIDQVKRDPATAAANAATGSGISNSLHLDGLAADLLLYVNGQYQTSSSAYRAIGEHWKLLHPLNRWGGDFHRPDGNHFSSTRGGVR